MLSKLAAMALLLCWAIASPSKAETLTVKFMKTDDSPLISGKFTARSIGPVQLKAGKVKISNNAITITDQSTSKSPKADTPRVVLIGTVFGTSLRPAQQKKRILSGYVFFNSGEAIAKLRNDKHDDQVAQQNGIAFKGQIQAAGKGFVGLEVTKHLAKNLPMRLVGDISASRVYRFTIAALTDKPVNPGVNFSATADMITFTPTYPPPPGFGKPLPGSDRYEGL